MTIDFEAKALDLVLGWLTEDIDKGLDIIRSQTLSASLVPRVAKWGRSIATRAREEALEEAAGVCEQWASELGDEHGKLCACMSHNPDACDCWLSEPENRIRALKEKP